MVTHEIWKPVVGYEGYYEVSNTGKVRGVDRILPPNSLGVVRHYKGKLLNEHLARGYLIVRLCKDGCQKTSGVHRLVAQAFIPNPDNLPVINHKDENKLNNNVDNLEWCTMEYNNKYGTHGTMSVGSKNPRAKLSEKDIPVIRNRLKNGESSVKIANDYDVTIGMIQHIKHGRSWRSVE